MNEPPGEDAGVSQKLFPPKYVTPLSLTSKSCVPVAAVWGAKGDCSGGDRVGGVGSGTMGIALLGEGVGACSGADRNCGAML